MTQPVIEPAYADLVPVTIIWDAQLGSPPELGPSGQNLGGKVVAVPPTFLPLRDRGALFGLKGFSRRDGQGGWQWVLQGDVDPVDAFVDTLTGKVTGWSNAASRATVKLMIQRLFSAGIPRGTIATQIPQFYNAVAAEVVAEQAAGV